MDLISLLDPDMCGKYIWSKVPSSKVAMILGMRGDLCGGILTRVDFKRWMLECIEKHSAGFPMYNDCIGSSGYMPHIIDMNDMAKAVFVSTATPKRLLDEDYMVEVLGMCVDAQMGFSMAVEQCSYCSQTPTSRAHYSTHCTRVLSTCLDVAKCLRRVVSRMPKDTFELFKFTMRGLDVDSTHGEQILEEVKGILQATVQVHSLEMCNVAYTCGSDRVMLDVLRCAKRVENVAFRNIKAYSRTDPDMHYTPDCSHGYIFRSGISAYLGVPCMSVRWLNSIYKADKACSVKRLTLSGNVLMPNQLQNCVEILYRCPSLEELHFTGGRHGSKTGNLGVWVLTEMSSYYRSNPLAKFGSLKVVSIDIDKPTLQVQTEEQGGDIDADVDASTLFKPWHDPYPSELWDFQAAKKVFPK